MVKKKKIVLIADGIPQKNGAGISQTLYNLFSVYPERITVIFEQTEDLTFDLYPLDCDTLLFRGIFIYPVANRLSRYLNPTIGRINCERLIKAPLSPEILLLREKCIVVVSTNLLHKLIFAWKLMNAGFVVVPYFMDDWLDGNVVCWKSGSVQQVAADLLRKAPARLMISINLQKILEQRYQLPFAPTLIVHNPSPLPTQTHTKFPPSGDLGGQTHPHTYFAPSGGTKGGTHTPTIPVNLSTNQPVNLIIYAGSIWPMHADALIAVAKAIQLLNASGKKDFSLCIYTSKGHWEKYKSMLQGEGVHWGGWLPYDEVRKKFSDGWLLLCTASFEKAQQAFTNSSVQTKLTDYIAAGRPVLVVAPTGAASGEWVLNETCGYWLQTRDPAEIATQLQQLAEQPFNWQQKAEKALALASGTYSTAAVQQRLYQFLNTHG
jgi:glycosyltransferase involved in cell wall biosynthesis